MQLNFTKVIILNAVSSAALAFIWLLAPQLLLKAWHVAQSPEVALIGRRSAALFAGMSVLQFSARNIADLAARRAFVKGFSTAYIFMAALGLFELFSGHAGPGILSAVSVEIGMAVALIASVWRQNQTTGSVHMTTQQHRVTLVTIPSDSGVFRYYAATNLADAYSIELPSDASTNPEVLARFIFSHQAPWISYLMAIRDAVVGRFGLKTAWQLTALGAESETGRLGIFKIYVTSPTEIIVGEDDKHLDFRLSVLCSHQPSPDGKRYLTLSTVVHCHNRLGRLYILAIAPFHRLVVQSSLRSAARIGWPLVTQT